MLTWVATTSACLVQMASPGFYAPPMDHSAESKWHGRESSETNDEFDE